LTYEEFATTRLHPLLRYATMLTGDAHLAEGLVQEVTDPSEGLGAIIRDRHQVAYLRAVLGKLVAERVLTDPAELARLLGAAGTGLVVDLRGASPLDVATELRPALREVVGVATPSGGVVGYGGHAGPASPPRPPHCSRQSVPTS
jgi:hypothetical protein